MYILRIEHSVPNYDGWKKAFDSDPVSREKSGVRRYSIYRPTDDEKYVLIDLEFNSADKAKGMLTSLRQLWARVEGQVMMNPTARILEIMEAKQVS